jgi:glycosyltransferase involved in cell wall biosynthesis
VDNASADETAELVKGFRSSWLTVKYIYEPRKGKSVCLNRALFEAKADIILLTDDDVRPHPEWIPTMCAPILEGRADAVAGAIEIPPHLHRNWMEDLHRIYLASTDALDPGGIQTMIGANCAFSRKVLDKVPGFDPELGPGALGFCEGILFFRQVVNAGYRLAAVFDQPMMHHFDPSRLLRCSFVQRAKAEGRSCAYMEYHLEHREIRLLFLRVCAAFVRLQVRRRWPGVKWPHKEGIAEWEFWSIRRLAFRRQYMRERRRVRNQGKKKFVRLYEKLSALIGMSPAPVGSKQNIGAVITGVESKTDCDVGA